MTTLTKFIFVSASWFPIYFLIGVLAWDDNRKLAVGAFVFGALSGTGIVLLEKFVRKRHAKEYITVKECSHKQDDIFMYVITYIPPFFAVDARSVSRIVALCLLYSFIFISYIRLKQYHLNPIFVFFGYEVFRIVTVDDVHKYVIAPPGVDISPGKVLRIATIGELAIVA